jgi:integrase
MANKMKTSYNIVFNRKKKLNKDDKAPVQIEVYQEGKRRYFNTGVYLSEKDWLGKDLIAKDKMVKLAVNQKLMELHKFENKHLALYDSFNLSDFDKMKEPKAIKKVSLTFTDFFNQQLDIEKKNIGYATWRQQKTNFDFFKKFTGNNVRFEDLTFDLIQRYDFHLKDIRKCKQNTVWKRHGQLRKYIILAIKHDYLAANKNPYLHFKSQTELTNKVYLNNAEIVRFENLIFTEDQKLMEMARDMFLFSCYTGLRYSDIDSLKNENFIESDEGLILKFVAKKTGKGMEIPLFLLFNGKPQQIAQKHFRKDGKRIFFGMTNPKANKFLKVLSILANIPKTLHFHASRHTFGTQMVSKTDITVVQDLMQHSDLKTTKGYLHLTQQERNERLTKIDWTK